VAKIGVTDVTYILVHGAWHGAWAWDPITARLSAQGQRVDAVNLPSVTQELPSTATFADDVACVVEAIDRAQTPVILVGHSYGGMVITQAAVGRDDVAHLCFVTALVLDVGQSLAGEDDTRIPDWVDLTDDRGASKPRDPVFQFYGDVDADVAKACADRLGWQSTDALRGPITATAWRDHPSSYVLCSQDEAISFNAQTSMARRTQQQFTLASAHSPFLSQPDALTQILLQLL
jgi:pimeloyl-ACP methyl ester carboxylesterase